MKKLEELQKRFQNKQINRMVSFRKECPLTFSEKTVFSYMFFRMRKKGNVAPASVRKLSKVSGMHRDTIAKALRRLETYGLVRCRDGKWRLTTEGVRNHSDWFGFRGKGRNHEDLAYHYFPQPTKESPITIIDCLVMVSDQFQPKLRSALLAARFGVSWATIDRSRKKLRNAEFQLDWIRDIEHKKKPKQDLSRQRFMDQFGEGTLTHTLATKMLDAGWSQQQVSNFFVAMEQFEDDCRDIAIFRKLLDPGKQSFDNFTTKHTNPTTCMTKICDEFGIPTPA